MSIIKTSILLLTTFIAISLMSCDSGGEMPEKTVQFPSIKDVPASKWENLAQKKIYFGHQSVGFNIVDGIKDVMKENPQIKLNIVETANESDFKVGLFAHSKVGENKDPKSKIDEFARLMDEELGNNTDIAFFKFCYIDMIAGTDVGTVFSDYKNTMLRLRNAFPKTTFVHVTVPVRIVQTGVRVWIKKVIGRPIGGYDDNIKRNQFNELLRKEFRGKEPIFDLAKIESISPDGTRSAFSKDGETYYSLVPEYTQDGGHLNEKGRRIVAEQLLILLANLN